VAPDEFKKAIKRLGFTQADFGSYVGSTTRTVNEWASTKGGGPPEVVVQLLRHMQRSHIDPAPIDQTIEAAESEVSLHVAAIVVEAGVQGWDQSLITDAIKRVAEQRLELLAARITP